MSSSSSSSSSAASSLAAKAIRASSAHRDSSLSSAYSSSPPVPTPPKVSPFRPYAYYYSVFASIEMCYLFLILQEVVVKNKNAHEYTSMKSLNNEPKRSFWGSLASKAKALLDDEDPPQHLPQSPTRMDHNSTPSSTTSGTKVGFKIHPPLAFIILFSYLS